MIGEHRRASTADSGASAEPRPGSGASGRFASSTCINIPHLDASWSPSLRTLASDQAGLLLCDVNARAQSRCPHICVSQPQCTLYVVNRVGGKEFMEEVGEEGSAFTCSGQIGRARKEVMEWGVKTGKREGTCLAPRTGDRVSGPSGLTKYQGTRQADSEPRARSRGRRSVSLPYLSTFFTSHQRIHT